MRVYIPLQMHPGLRVSGILFLNMLLPVIVDATRNSLWNANMVAPAEGAASLDSSVSLPLKPAPRGLGSRQRLRIGQGRRTRPAPAWCAVLDNLRARSRLWRLGLSDLLPSLPSLFLFYWRMLFDRSLRVAAIPTLWWGRGSPFDMFEDFHASGARHFEKGGSRRLLVCSLDLLGGAGDRV